ncbi:MAG: VCBS repeat-containing protein [Planctomycetes bacterium]|nr:VCBS repeat-containing protein [Planctomycetota bacterium]
MHFVPRIVPALAFVGAQVVAMVAVPIVAVGQESRALFDAALVELDGLHRYQALVDLNGDGRMDAVGAWPDKFVNHRAIVTGWINDGTRLVEAWSVVQPVGPIAYAVPNYVAVGSVDGNANGDFIVTAGANVTVYQSNGAAPPTVRSTWTEANIPNGVVLADFDGNGVDDPATSHLHGYSIRLDQGFGSTPTVTHTAFLGGAEFTMFDVTEVDGNGAADLLFFVDDFLVLVPVANGIPGPPQAFVPGVTMPMPATGDIDGDGDDDIVVFGAMPDTYVTLRRTGASTFVMEAPVAGGPATELADVDGDGDLDGICCSSGGSDPPLNSSASKFEITINDGTGSFAPAITLPGIGSQHIAGATDLDGDGDVDLVAGRCVYYARGPIRGPTVLVTSGFAGPLTERTTFDLDGDGDVDLTRQALFEGPIGSYRKNGGDGSFIDFMPVLPVAPATVSWSSHGYYGDLDGDGSIDRLMRGFDSNTGLYRMYLWRNPGGGEYAAAVPITAPGTYFGVSFESDRAVVADLDGDGDTDVTADGVLYFNDGAGSFTTGPTVAARVTYVVDLNNDGIKDLVMRGRTALGLGGGAFAAAVAYPFFVPVSGIEAVADFDHDGDLDIAEIAYGTNAGQESVVLVNDGTGAFTMTTPLAGLGEVDMNSGPMVRAVVAGDMNGDGLTDIARFPGVLGSSTTTLINLRKSDNSGFLPPIEMACDASVLRDVDGDGDLDLLRMLQTLNRTFSPQAGGGSRVQYGAAAQGSGGMRPTLGASGPFRVGESAQLRLRGAAGPGTGLVVVGLTAAKLVDKPSVGLSIHTFPFALVLPVPVSGTGEAGSGQFTFPYVVPASAAGFHFFHQAFVADAGAPSGATSTNGLDLFYGP